MCLCVCVCPCVSLLLLATTCKSQFHDSHAHFTDNKTTQKGAGRKEEGKGVKKKTNFGSCILHLQKVQTQCVSVFLEKLLVHTPTQRHTHTHSHMHAVCTGCNVPKFKLKHPFFSFHMRHTINDPPPPPILCSDTLPVPTLAAQFFTISVLFSFMALLFFCFCPPLVVF